MAYDIGPKIGIDGEAEFRRQINEVNASIKTLGTEMSAVVSEFDAGDKSQEKLTKQSEVLNKQIDAQKKKLELLKKGLDDATEAFTAADPRTQKWAQAVNQATADLNKMERELKDVSGELDKGFLGKLKDEISSFASGGGLGSILTAGVGVGAVVGGIKELGGAMFELVDSTQEYRKAQGQLTTAFEAANLSQEAATATYRTLQGVIGETDQAVEAAQQIALLADSEEDAAQWAELAAGVVGRFGDALQPETFFEAANETIKLGEATGAYTQMLEGAGYSVEDFNAGLAACTNEGQKQAYMLQITDQILGDAAAQYRETNAAIIATNESNEKLSAATARLGGMLAPVTAGIKGLAADALNSLLDGVDAAIAFVTAFPAKAKQVGSDIVTGLWSGISSMISWLGEKIRGFCGGVLDNIKEFFDINSPSGVMKREVGKQMAAGVGLGFVDEIGAVRRKMDSAMDELVPSQSAMYNRQGQSGLGGADVGQLLSQLLDAVSGGRGNNGTAPVYNLVLDGVTVGRLLAPYVTNEYVRSGASSPVTATAR